MIDTRQHNNSLRRNRTILVGLVLFIGLAISAIYIHLSSTRQAAIETNILGNSLAQQSELLIRPLLLANDRVSLNYLLNELNQLTYISGLQVQNQAGVVVARAGSLSEHKIQQRILQQEKTIATVTLWLDSKPVALLLRSQLWPLAIIAVGSILLALTLLWSLSRREPASSQEDTPDNSNRFSDLSFSETLAIQQETNAPSDEDSTANAFTDTTQTIDTSAFASRAPEDTSNSTPENSDPIAVPADNQQSPAQTTAEAAIDPNAPQGGAPLHMDTLVELLKPEHENTPQMPKFEHQPQDLEPHKNSIKADSFIVEEKIPEPAKEESPKTKNPLQEIADREEVQLGLYSFEDELELILAPQDAIYLFYIDSTTASSDNMNGDDKATLLNVYFHLAKQVARIYNGEVEQLENRDILLRFELRDDQDSHGVNALCAAILFNLLYKGFNQSRIKGFQPVLSLQMSLSRGHHNKHTLVKEEAHFLTRTTASNELISHTALTEAPLLKKALLKDAEIRREDEDKVLLLKVTPNHQALLQKQANHLLTKIFKK